MLDLDPFMVSLNDLKDDDRIFSNKDRKQTQMYTHTQLADAKKKVLLFFYILLTKSNELSITL